MAFLALTAKVKMNILILQREAFGLMTVAGYVLMVWDLLTIGKVETRVMVTAPGSEGQGAYAG